MSTVTLGQLVSVPEAAKMLGISKVLVLRYIAQTRLRAEKHAGRWMIDASSVDEFKTKPRRVGNPNFLTKLS